MTWATTSAFTDSSAKPHCWSFCTGGAYVSSVTGEKLTEWQVIRAFEAASAALAVPPRRFALAPVWAERPFYRLYLESREPLREVMADAVDAGLARINIEYNGKRTSGRLGAIRTIALQPGAFAAFDAERAGRHRMANEQYKPQCLFTKPGDDATLMAAMAPPQGAEPKARTGARLDAEGIAPVRSAPV